MATVLWTVVEMGGARVVVTSNQRVAQAPAQFKPVARVYDPQGELHCPSYAWDYGDGSTSGNEPYCEPYDIEEDRRPRRVIQPLKFHTYRVPGEYVITFTVTAGDIVLRDRVTVVVTGPTLH